MSAAFDALRRLLHRSAGLALDADKAYLAESRLHALMQQAGAKTLDDFMRRLEPVSDLALLQNVVEAMTTNETLFFRDRSPFQTFKSFILPALIEARQADRRIRIWCAAGSTGQEPYSLAMILDEEVKKLVGWHVEILATDISQRVIATAREGRYSQFEVQRGLPISHLMRYFQNEGDTWRINEHLRSRVRFEQFNLLSSYRDLGTFDVIFCRNVLIYFDLATKRDVLERMARVLPQDGSLVMGAAETTVGVTDALVPHPEHRFIYGRRRAAASTAQSPKLAPAT